MTAITTDDCKRFLSGFFLVNPNLITQIYDDPTVQNDLQKDLSQPNLWKRGSKRKSDPNATYPVYASGGNFRRGPRYAQPSQEIPPADISWVREFCLNPDQYEDGVKFLVLEDTAGKLFLGEYVGD